MSKTKLVTDDDAIVYVDFRRDADEPDSSGDLVGDPFYLATSVRGDLQPIEGKVDLAQTALAAKSTDLFLVEERVTAGVRQNDYLETAGVRYRVTEVRDYGASMPQEFYLERMTEP